MSPASRDALKGHAMPYATRSMPPAGARVTMKDVAAALGVSTATVSRALQDDGQRPTRLRRSPSRPMTFPKTPASPCWWSPTS
jgi:hypothetical protein